MERKKLDRNAPRNTPTAGFGRAPLAGFVTTKPPGTKPRSGAVLHSPVAPATDSTQIADNRMENEGGPPLPASAPVANRKTAPAPTTSAAGVRPAPARH
jgi:hypothetical protein